MSIVCASPAGVGESRLARSMNDPADKNVLHLVVTARDLLAGTVTEEWFSRSPVTVGRRDECELRLNAEAVSSRHGAFMFGPGVPFQYVDFGSTNGSVVDGVKIDPNVPVALHDRSVVGVAPFLLIVRTEMGPARNSSEIGDSKTPTSGPG